MMIQIWGVEYVLLDQRTVLLIIINKKKEALGSFLGALGSLMGLELFPASYVFPQIETMVPFLLQLKAAQSLASGSQWRAIVAGSTKSRCKLREEARKVPPSTSHRGTASRNQTRSRGGATGKAAGPFHLSLPAFPTSPVPLEAPMSSPSDPRHCPCSWSYCSFLCTFCSGQRKPPRVSG